MKIVNEITDKTISHALFTCLPDFKSTEHYQIISVNDLKITKKKSNSSFYTM